MPFRVSPLEIGLVLLIILIVFGAGKLPEVGRAVGRGIREFRQAASRGEHVGEKEPQLKTSQR